MLSTAEHAVTESCERWIYILLWIWHYKNRLSIKTNTPSESGEISKKAKSLLYLKHDEIVKSGLLCRSQQVSVSNSKIEQIGSKSKVKQKI